MIGESETIASACAFAGFPLDQVCGGRGTCGKCKVEIVKNGETKEVLACQEKVSDELIILLKRDQINKKVNILTEGDLIPVEFDPAVKKVYIEKESLKTPPCSGDWENINNLLNVDIKTPSLELLQKLSNILHKQDISGITLTYWHNELLDLDVNNTEKDLYGFAIDVGTTTVVAYLYNLHTGERMGIYSALNGQVSEGADVITRILACINNPGGLAKLQEKILDTINQLVEQAVNEHHIDNGDIYYVALCGNSTMQHLFLGLNPEFLGKSPFTSTTTSGVVTKAKQLNININPNAIVYFLPLIGGFVGADTLAVLLSLPETDHLGYRLIIDLGTNGEIVIGNKDRMLAASTAAGPALEGGGIQFGMRGTTGAIERVNLQNGNIAIKVIGGGKPTGICGSGLIDAVAEMLRVGIITETGKLLKKEEYLNTCPPEYRGLADRLETIDGINCFILATEEQSQNGQKIYITQKDIRAVQLAKSAIYTGCNLLVQEYGIKPEQLKEILIAGAFGNYIDIEKGQYIGLLPSWGVPTRSIGNAAGAGVQLFMLSKEIREKTYDIQRKVTHIELATNPYFQNEFVRNMKFSRKS
ncbi:ASKHA domain-containing protein [Thermosediminibacter oceani]|uniref:Ferredoxin n=1 Tax=Thermosediminibacter oceani (strain ATCC BAA-1034 / DSM 16646 / JW/IW-1228P) TaxID=555079 RepID=D9S2D3_THEOJ|nr:ASKHA domain-containing protein [Thermosediminibacter oceani]ADL07560.1 ferredoxin [Thermosediminibacter oceani DSM 16646]